MTAPAARQALADLLKQRQAALGLRSQRDLSALLCLGHTSVSRWLQAKGRMPNSRQIEIIGAKLQCRAELAEIQSAARARRPRLARFRGFVHGDGI